MLAVMAGPKFSRSERGISWSASGQYFVSLPDAESGSSRSGSGSISHEKDHRVRIFVDFGLAFSLWSNLIEKLLIELASWVRGTISLGSPIPHDARIAAIRTYRGHTHCFAG